MVEWRGPEEGVMAFRYLTSQSLFKSSMSSADACGMRARAMEGSSCSKSLPGMEDAAAAAREEPTPAEGSPAACTAVVDCGAGAVVTAPV